MPVYDTVLVAIITVVFSSAVTYLGARLQFRNELRAKIDINLRDIRTKNYSGIYKELRIVSKVPIRYGLVRYMDLINLFKKLHHWYFDECGGLYLSNSTRESLFGFKISIMEQLQLQLSKSKPSGKKLIPIPKFLNKRQNNELNKLVIQLLDEKLSTDQNFEQYKNIEYHLLDELEDYQLKKIVDSAHKFRESLAKDIGGRAEAHLR